MELQGSRQLCSKNNLELPAVLNGLQIEVPLTEASFEWAPASYQYPRIRHR